MSNTTEAGSPSAHSSEQSGGSMVDLLAQAEFERGQTAQGREILDGINAKMQTTGLRRIDEPWSDIHSVDSLDHVGLNPEERVHAVAFTAGFNRPEGAVYMGRSVDRQSQPPETVEQYAWRRGINKLRDWENRGPQADPDRVRLSDIAHDYLRRLSLPPGASSDQQIAVGALDFSVLPPSGEKGDDGWLERQLSKHEKPGLHLDQERIDRIKALKNEFGGTCYESTIDHNPYLILVLDLPTGSDQPLRRVALAEFPYSREVEAETGTKDEGAGALYFYEEEPNSAGTWDEVFALGKADAKSLGAIKIVHTESFDDRLRQLLTGGSDTAVT